jgi:tRNA dimethylallyltransferase
MTVDKMNLTKRPVLIAGPTASGKSAVALALAGRFRGRIINADSMQVYADLRVITARPTASEERQAPHRLYGHVDAAENYSAGRWLTDVQAELAACAVDGMTPILVGGTGLYFKLLTTGLAAIPAIPEETRKAVRARLEREGAPALHAWLAERDPETAGKLHAGDSSRIVRAVEVLEATGRPLADWQRENMPPILDPKQTVRLFLDRDREQLRRRVDNRFDRMLDDGALEEVQALAARHLDPALPAMKAHGVPWLIRHFNGEIGLDRATQQGKIDTFQYTKRQFTWFRNQLPDWPWEKPENALERLTAELERSR